jgi:hypothetical protein
MFQSSEHEAKSVEFYQSKSTMSFSWLNSCTRWPYLLPEEEGSHTFTLLSPPADAMSDPSLFHFETMTMELQL